MASSNTEGEQPNLVGEEGDLEPTGQQTREQKWAALKKENESKDPREGWAKSDWLSRTNKNKVQRTPASHTADKFD